MIRKADIFLAIFLIISGLLVSCFFVSGKDAGSTVNITVNGELHSTYPLSEDRTVEVAENNHINKITIKDSHVSMTFSDCPNQDCVKHRTVSKNGESIICLPHKLIVEIEGDDPSFDAISQ